MLEILIAVALIIFIIFFIPWNKRYIDAMQEERRTGKKTTDEYVIGGPFYPLKKWFEKYTKEEKEK